MEHNYHNEKDYNLWLFYYPIFQFYLGEDLTVNISSHKKSYTLPRHSWHYIMAPFLHSGTEELYVGTFLETNHAFFHKSWVISKPLIHEALENCRPLLVELVACGLCKSMPAIDRSCA